MDKEIMKRSGFLGLGLLLVMVLAGEVLAREELTVFCGAALKRPVEEITEVFQKKTGVKVNVIYAGIGTLFGQIALSKRGDVFIAPSPDIMERAARKGLVLPNSMINMAYVVPCINVQKGNPKMITGLTDLLRPEVRVAIGNPEIVYVGALAVEIVHRNFQDHDITLFRKNLVTYAEDFNKLAAYLVLKQVDAVLGFHFLEGWYPGQGRDYQIATSRDPANRISKGRHHFLYRIPGACPEVSQLSFRP